MIKKLESMDEYKQALKDAGDKAVLIDFFATWCGPCRMIAPFLEEKQEKYSNIVFYKVDVDEQEEISAENNISAMPTFIIYKNGTKADELMGANQEKLEALMKQYN